MMQMAGTTLDKFGEIFPHMENILHCGLYIYDASDNSQVWSPGVYMILGLEPGAIKSNFEEFVPFILPEDRHRVIRSVQESRGKREPYKIEFSILNAKGIYKRIYAENTFRDGSHPGSYDGIIKDITENHFYKKALEQKVQQLDKSNQSLQEFVYIASHDLQEPLRKISTFVGRLKSRFEPVLEEEGVMYVDRILNSTHNMQTLLEDLLSFSRLSFTDKEFEKVSLADCLSSVLSDLEIKIEETRAAIHADPLPEIEGYPTQIRQLFNNLLSNALKFRKRDVTPVIEIKVLEVEESLFQQFQLPKDLDFIRLDFCDNGIGFEQEFSEKIFKMFQRLNGKSEYAGSGVGLSICKRIADNHHGVIYAASKPGEGSVFTVILPLKQTAK
jgi:signal transduction histidine kinase